MFRTLPIFAVLATTAFILTLAMSHLDGIPYELTTVATDISPLHQPGHTDAIEVLRKRTLCDEQSWTLDANMPATLYQVHLPASVYDQYTQLVFFQQAAINNQFALLYGRADQCLQVRSSGRSLPYEQRFYLAMFPNSQIDSLDPDADIFIVLQDAKSRNLWLGISDLQGFQKQANLKWLYSGLYLGALFVYTVIGLTVTVWQRNRLALIYSSYTLVITLWFLQNFGIGSAFLPFWPGTAYFSYLQAIFTGLIVISITTVCVFFLSPGKRITTIIIGIATVVTLLFFSSPYYDRGYMYGAFGLSLLALFVLVNLLRSFATHASFEKLFALGLISSISIGSLQAISVFTGSNFGGFAIFAFPVGNLFESTFWLMAIIDRMLKEFNRIQVRLLFEATHDPLTRLPNRTFLENRLKTIVSKGEGAGKGLFFIDLDRFKQINDSLSHATGDNFLKLIANRLRALHPSADTIARFGGDEFCIVINNVNDRGTADRLGNELIQTIAKPITLVGRELRLSASIGTCLNLDEYSESENIIRNADMSMYAAKNNGRACMVIFSNEMHERELEKFQIEQDILPGLRKNEFEVFFQPIVHLPQGDIAGFEALVRWQHPGMGWLAPYRFIQVAEDTGLIRAISKEVVQQVTDTITRWKTQGVWKTGLYVSVNIAGQQLIDNSLNLMLQQTLNNGGISPDDIRIEITESSLVTDFPLVAKTLLELREQGFKILIDDFGTGYSSLMYLHQMPIDVLKIDRSFVTEVEVNPNKRALIKTIIAMAKALGLDVIAEGVELKVHQDILFDYGCTKAQGYLYDKPGPARDIEQRWLVGQV